MIPKVIHYCWFGRNKKPDLIEKCIESWREYCPDWEIREWNEDNFDVNAVPFMQEAYERKRWAFVSDVARLLIIYQHGGVYLDTDVELRAPLDKLLSYDAFFAFESNVNINTGVGFGACKEHRVIGAMIEYYKERHFMVNGREKMTPCPALNTEALQGVYPQFLRNGSGQRFEGVCILPFHQYSVYAKHHGAASWVEGKKTIRKEYRDTKLKRFMRDPKRFHFIEKHFSKRVYRIYTFLAYDLLELGCWYYVKRFVKKLRRSRESN